jgi:calcineurin-like phosphoesterase family protein
MVHVLLITSSLMLTWYQVILSDPMGKESFFERLSKTAQQTWSSLTGTIPADMIDELLEQTLPQDLEKFLETYVPEHPATLQTEEDYKVYLEVAFNIFKKNTAWLKTYQGNPHAEKLLEFISTDPTQRNLLLPNFETYFTQQKPQRQPRLRLISKKPWPTLPKEFRTAKLEAFARYLVDEAINLEDMKFADVKSKFIKAAPTLKKTNSYLFDVLNQYNQASISFDEFQNLKKLVREKHFSYEHTITQNEQYFQRRLHDLKQKRRALEEQLVYTIARTQNKEIDQISWPAESTTMFTNFTSTWDDYIGRVKEQITEIDNALRKYPTTAAMQEARTNLTNVKNDLNALKNKPTILELKQVATQITESGFYRFEKGLVEVGREIEQGAEKVWQQTKKTGKTVKEKIVPVFEAAGKKIREGARDIWQRTTTGIAERFQQPRIQENREEENYIIVKTKEEEPKIVLEESEPKNEPQVTSTEASGLPNIPKEEKIFLSPNIKLPNKETEEESLNNKLLEKQERVKGVLANKFPNLNIDEILKKLKSSPTEKIVKDFNSLIQSIDKTFKKGNFYDCLYMIKLSRFLQLSLFEVFFEKDKSLKNKMIKAYEEILTDELTSSVDKEYLQKAINIHKENTNNFLEKIKSALPIQSKKSEEEKLKQAEKEEPNIVLETSDKLQKEDFIKEITTNFTELKNNFDKKRNTYFWLVRLKADLLKQFDILQKFNNNFLRKLEITKELEQLKELLNNIPLHSYSFESSLQDNDLTGLTKVFDGYTKMVETITQASTRKENPIYETKKLETLPTLKISPQIKIPSFLEIDEFLQKIISSDKQKKGTLIVGNKNITDDVVKVKNSIAEVQQLADKLKPAENIGTLNLIRQGLANQFKVLQEFNEKFLKNQAITEALNNLISSIKEEFKVELPAKKGKVEDHNKLLNKALEDYNKIVGIIFLELKLNQGKPIVEEPSIKKKLPNKKEPEEKKVVKGGGYPVGKQSYETFSDLYNAAWENLVPKSMQDKDHLKYNTILTINDVTNMLNSFYDYIHDNRGQFNNKDLWLDQKLPTNTLKFEKKNLNAYEIYKPFYEPFVEKRVLPADSVIAIHGDLHGGFFELLSFIKDLKDEKHIDDNFAIKDPSFYMLFLGDYTDRGIYGLEVVHTILRLKLINPNNVFIVRGNHETEGGFTWGFYNECDKKFKDKKFYEMIRYMCNSFPVALYVGTDSYCFQACHGGMEIGFNPKNLLSDKRKHLKQLLDNLDREAGFKSLSEELKKKLINNGYSANKFNVKKPHDFFEIGFLWNDFFIDDQGLISYTDGRGYKYGKEITEEVLKNASVEGCPVIGVLRAHQQGDLEMLNSIKEGNGISKLWNNPKKTTSIFELWNGVVCTFSVAPDAGYKINYDGFGLLTLYQEQALLSTRQKTFSEMYPKYKAPEKQEIQETIRLAFNQDISESDLKKYFNFVKNNNFKQGDFVAVKRSSGNVTLGLIYDTDDYDMEKKKPVMRIRVSPIINGQAEFKEFELKNGALPEQDFTNNIGALKPEYKVELIKKEGEIKLTTENKEKGLVTHIKTVNSKETIMKFLSDIKKQISENKTPNDLEKRLEKIENTIKQYNLENDQSINDLLKDITDKQAEEEKKKENKEPKIILETSLEKEEQPKLEEFMNEKPNIIEDYFSVLGL